MTLVFWGRGLLVGGLVGVLLSLGPYLLLTAFPGTDAGFFGTLAALLTITVAPLAVLALSVGAILLLVALVRRGRS
jgi:energy-converting hydrogenase Eha subunit C